MRDRRGPATSDNLVQDKIDLLASSIPGAEAVKILASADIMADFFRSRLSGLFPEGLILKECRPTVLRQRLGSRQVVSYRLLFVDKSGRRAGTLKRVLKRYAAKAEGKKAYSIMRMLWENGFDRNSRLMVPQPFCYLEDLGLMVLETVHGMQLRKNLHQSGPVALDRMKAVARWLMKLHQLHAEGEVLELHADDEASMRHFVDRVGSKDPRLLPMLEELLSTIFVKLSFSQCSSMTPVHGDFQCENIFVDRERVTVVDFDRFCISDPARDLGYFAAQMRAMAFLTGALHGSVYEGLKAFWEEYMLAASAEERAALSARSTFFAARKCLQNIFYISYVLSGGEMEILPILVNEAGRFAKADRMEEVLGLPVSTAH